MKPLINSMFQCISNIVGTGQCPVPTKTALLPGRYFQNTTPRLLLPVLFTILTLSQPIHAQDPTPFANCRLGVGGAYSPNLSQYNISQLNIGQYLDWSARSNPAAEIGLPAGVGYIQTVRVHQRKTDDWDSPYVQPPAYTVSPNLSTLTARVAAAPPGSIWRIGNEIERRDWNGGGQDEITPELYAQAFHEIRQVIKTADPTARIAIGSVIEATPLRLAYLDRVWDAYYNRYGYTMGRDIDVWIVHGFLLREVRNSWGAEIPAGFDNSDADPTNNYNPATGFLYGAAYSDVMAAHHNLNYFKQFTEALRVWMAAHGERNKPLINTEYGILYTGISDTDVNNYLIGSFDYLLTAANAATGYPADENRLVQGWVWYSLEDAYWNANLFDPASKALTTHGQAWKSYVTNPAKPLASQPRRNLRAVNLRVSPVPAIALPGQTVTVTLMADIANSGNTPTVTNNNLVVKFWDGPPNQPGSGLIGMPRVLADLPGCGGLTTATAVWSGRSAGAHPWYVEIVPIAGETSTADNMAGSAFTVIAGTPTADLTIDKAVDNLTPYTGQVINFTLVTTNAGPDTVTNVVVTDTLPAGLTFTGYTATQGNYFTSGKWEVGTLAPNSGATLTLSTRVNAGQGGQTITNQAVVTSTSPLTDPTPTNTDAIAIIPIANADLEIAVSSETSPNRITYSSLVRNNGPDFATAVQVQNFVLPAGLTLDSYLASQGSFNPATGIWTAGAVAANFEATLVVAARVDPALNGSTVHINNITVSGSQADLEPANNQANAAARAMALVYLPLIMK
jgi:uncharacterized repeat protein (TIGR01451 family)